MRLKIHPRCTTPLDNEVRFHHSSLWISSASPACGYHAYRIGAAAIVIVDLAPPSGIIQAAGNRETVHCKAFNLEQRPGPPGSRIGRRSSFAGFRAKTSRLRERRWFLGACTRTSCRGPRVCTRPPHAACTLPLAPLLGATFRAKSQRPCG